MEGQIIIKDNGARVEWLDIEKGISIIMVIIAHLDLELGISDTVSSAIYKFHMPLFMTISGYITSMVYVKCGKIQIRKLILQIINSYIVYVFFSAVYCIMKIFTAVGNTALSVSDLLSILYRPVGHYWFIYTTIVLYIFFLFTWKLLRKHKTCLLILVLEIIVFKLISMYLYITITPINYLIAWLPYWHFGIILEVNKDFLDKTVRKTKIDLVVAFAVFILSIISDKGIFVITSMIISYGFFELIYRYFELINQRLKIVLETFGKNSLPIYLVHSYFTFVFTIISKRLFFLPEVVNYVICCAGLLISVIVLALGITTKCNYIINPVKYFINRKETL